MDIFLVTNTIGEVLNLVGVLIIFGGIVISTALLILKLLEDHRSDLYKSYRKNLGKSILLGLEFLVAGDIIRTVTGDPSFVSIGILGFIVLIRSFLSITFEMEIDGRWPWHRHKKE